MFFRTEDPGIDLQAAKPIGHKAGITAKSMVRIHRSRQPYLYYVSTSYSN